MVGLRFGGRGVSNFEIVRAGAFMWARGAQHTAVCEVRPTWRRQRDCFILAREDRRGFDPIIDQFHFA
jgi:hypothetical protein